VRACALAWPPRGCAFPHLTSTTSRSITARGSMLAALLGGADHVRGVVTSERAEEERGLEWPSASMSTESSWKALGAAIRAIRVLKTRIRVVQGPGGGDPGCCASEARACGEGGPCFGGGGRAVGGRMKRFFQGDVHVFRAPADRGQLCAVRPSRPSSFSNLRAPATESGPRASPAGIEAINLIRRLDLCGSGKRGPRCRMGALLWAVMAMEHARTTHDGSGSARAGAASQWS
jgi:hypothetical protein